MTGPEADADAYLDPWCDVTLAAGGRSLFGFAPWHPATGGLSWLRSSAIVGLDILGGRARTASGRRYALGRCFRLEDLPREGEEAQVAFDLLLRCDAEDADAVAQVATDPMLDGLWLTARKAARHLGVEPPGRELQAVRAWWLEHHEAYRLRRSGGASIGCA